MSMSDQAARDTADLEKFGYKQELNRGLGTFSSFAVAFSYISPSTGIFTLFGLGMAAMGAYLFWAWPVVALFQFVVALNFAELSSHFPVAGSVYQWTKYLAGRGYAWFTGWFYLIAGILTVASVCATLPLALLPMLNTAFGWSLNTDLGSADQAVVAIVTLVLITVLNIYGVKLVAIVNNTGVIFEILGMVVFAIILAIAHNDQGFGVIVESRQDRQHLRVPGAVQSFVLPGGDVHEPVRDLRVRHGIDAGGGDPQPQAGSAQGGARFGGGSVRDRRHLPVGAAGRRPRHGGGGRRILRTGDHHRCGSVGHADGHLPARRIGRDLRVLHVDPDVHDQVGVRDGP